MVKNCALLIVIVVGIMIIRLFIDQILNFHLALNDLENKNYSAGIVHFERVLQSHIPFSPLEGASIKHLLSLAKTAEESAMPELALLCLETIRTSRYLSRHVTLPDASILERLNAEIVRLRTVAAFGKSSDSPRQEFFEKELFYLQTDIQPSLLWGLILVFSFICYVCSVFLWIRKDNLIFLITGLIFFSCWLLALFKV